MKKLIFSSCVSLIGILIAGCATTPSPQAKNLILSNKDLVRDCKKIDEFSAGSLAYMFFDSRIGDHNSRVEVLERAAKVGATHLVWLDPKPLPGAAPGAKGAAYYCDRFRYKGFSVRVPEMPLWKPINSFYSPDTITYCRQGPGAGDASTCFSVWMGDVASVLARTGAEKDFYKEVTRVKQSKSENDRIEATSNAFSLVKFKGNPCLEFSQGGKDRIAKTSGGGPLNLFIKGRNCRVPSDPNLWVEVALSRRQPTESGSVKWTDEELKLLDDLEFDE